MRDIAFLLVTTSDCDVFISFQPPRFPRTHTHGRLSLAAVAQIEGQTESENDNRTEKQQRWQKPHHRVGNARTLFEHRCCIGPSAISCQARSQREVPSSDHGSGALIFDFLRNFFQRFSNRCPIFGVTVPSGEDGGGQFAFMCHLRTISFPSNNNSPFTGPIYPHQQWRKRKVVWQFLANGRQARQQVTYGMLVSVEKSGDRYGVAV